jgi:hypothetical protein
MRIALILPLLLAACATPFGTERTYTVAEIEDHHFELIGHHINVIGYVHGCGGLSCAIQETSDPENIDDAFLSIGSSATFDHEVEPFLGRQIVVAATYTGDCVDADPNDDVIPVCADRVETLKQPKFLGLASAFKD